MARTVLLQGLCVSDGRERLASTQYTGPVSISSAASTCGVPLLGGWLGRGHLFEKVVRVDPASIGPAPALGVLLPRVLCDQARAPLSGGLVCCQIQGTRY